MGFRWDDVIQHTVLVRFFNKDAQARVQAVITGDMEDVSIVVVAVRQHVHLDAHDDRTLLR